MGAMEDGVQMHEIEVSPQTITAGRHKAAKILGKPMPPSDNEIARYIDAGLEPPTE